MGKIKIYEKMNTVFYNPWKIPRRIMALISKKRKNKWLYPGPYNRVVAA